MRRAVNGRDVNEHKILRLGLYVEVVGCVENQLDNRFQVIG